MKRALRTDKLQLVQQNVRSHGVERAFPCFILERANNLLPALAPVLTTGVLRRTVRGQQATPVNNNNCRFYDSQQQA